MCMIVEEKERVRVKEESKELGELESHFRRGEILIHPQSPYQVFLLMFAALCCLFSYQEKVTTSQREHFFPGTSLTSPEGRA